MQPNSSECKGGGSQAVFSPQIGRALLVIKAEDIMIRCGRGVGAGGQIGSRETPHCPALRDRACWPHSPCFPLVVCATPSPCERTSLVSRLLRLGPALPSPPFPLRNQTTTLASLFDFLGVTQPDANLW